MRSACQGLRPALSAYLDGELEPSQGGELIRHLDACAECSERLRAYREWGRQLRDVPPPEPPPQLDLRLRIAASQRGAARQGRRASAWLYWKLRWAAAFRAWAVPTAVGTAAALAIFTVLAGSVQIPSANGPLRPDVVLSYATPPRLASGGTYSLGAPVVVDAQIDATGHVYGYSVVDGPTSPQMIERLNNQLLLSVFQPATTVFGQPTTGSVLVSFGTVNVRG